MSKTEDRTIHKYEKVTTELLMRIGGIIRKFILTVLLLTIYATSVSAEIYNSPFGFSIDIPSHWLILSQKEIKENPDLFNLKDSRFKSFDKSLLEGLKSKIISGSVEFYFNQNTLDPHFSDNINVTKEIAKIPKTDSEAKKECEKLPSYILKVWGKPTKVYSCGIKKVANLESFYVEIDGGMDGTRSISYQIQKSPSIAINITATCKNESLNIIREEFEKMMTSIKMRVHVGREESGRSTGIVVQEVMPDSESKVNEYYSSIWKKIKDQWTVPEDVHKEMAGLETIIVLKINKDGEVQEMWYEKRSGNPQYDQTAWQAIKQAEPFSPFPKEFGDATVEVGIRFCPY